MSIFDAIVVGAGPTGLMLASELRLGGLHVAIVDARPPDIRNESRASGLHASSMEALDQRGLREAFEARGRPLPLVLFGAMPVDATRVDAAWPDGLILPQHATESILLEHARRQGVAVRWGTEVLHVCQDDDVVDVTVACGGATSRLRARYVVGCDGAHSSVRRSLGVRFEGEDPLSHWLVADVRLARPVDQPPFGRTERAGTYQLSDIEPGWFRVAIMQRLAPVDRLARVTLDELRQAMQEGLGDDYGLTEARWLSRFSDGTRQVRQYRHGRVLLAGDACHAHSPFGGQGLNLGIQDAMNLGWKLAAVVHGHAADALLDTYHGERHEVAAQAIALTRAQTVLIKPGSQIDALREIIRPMLSVPDVIRPLAGQLSGLTLRYPWGEGHHPCVGRRLPNLPLRDGRSLATLLHAGRWRYLRFAASRAAPLPAGWASRVDDATVEPQVADGTDQWTLPVLGRVPALDAVLVRPDGFVAWASPATTPSPVAALRDALEHWLVRPLSTSP